MADANKLRSVTRDLPALSVRADVQPSSLNPEKRTVDILWTTGARVLRGYFDPWFEELSLDPGCVRMGRLQNKAPFLNTHSGRDAAGVLGVVESASIDGQRGIATVRFAKAEDDADADRIFRKIQDGILKHISVGYRTYKAVKIEDGTTTIPVYRAVDWEPYELSICPMGEEDAAGIRSINDRTATNPCVFEERTMETPPAVPPAVAPVPAVVPASPPTPAPVGDDTRAARESGVQAERARIAQVRGLIARHGIGDELATRMLGDEKAPGATVEEARSLILEDLAARSGTVPAGTHIRIEAGETDGEKFARGASAWLFEKAGVGAIIRQAKERGVEAMKDVALDPGEFRGMTLLDLARASLERSRQSVRGLSKMDLVARAFTYRGAGMQTASDFPIVLENVLNKTLLAAYATTPDSWTKFCAVRSAGDFRTQNFYRNGAFGTLDQVTDGGEIKRKFVPDGEKRGFAIGTRGNIIAITRQAVVNDDMGAFTDLGARVGRAAKLSIEVDVYATLALNSGLGPTMADTNALFHSAHANVNGTGSALTVAGLDADRVVMASQKDPSGNEILDLRPAVLVVPVALGGQARVLNMSQYDTDAVAANATNKFQVPNKVAGLFKEIVDTARMTGTRRYLFADPNEAPVLAVAFLDGERNPYLETKLGWDIDGTEFKVRLDYGVGVIDTRGAVTNAGA